MISPNMNIEIAGIKFKNPFIAASGTFGFGYEFLNYMDISSIGGIALSGLTLNPKLGNPPPRIAETPSGILNSVGLQNPGLDFFLEHDLPKAMKLGTNIIANINGDTEEDFFNLALKLNDTPIHMLELNLSCPNVKEGGMSFGIDSKRVYSLTKSIKKCINKPLIVKLTPNVTDITTIALAAEEGGADALSLVNTFLGMAIDAKTRRPLLGNITGGLSGPAIKPLALRMVWQVSRKVEIPIIGMGGILSGEDVVEFLLAGASAVSVGTANLITPDYMIRIKDEFKTYMIKNNIGNIEELIDGLITD